jgi:hypothetical protein
MRERVAEQIGHQLADARRIGTDRRRQIEVRFDLPVVCAKTQLRDDLLQDRRQLHARLQIERDARAKPAARKIQHVVDQPAHADDTALKHIENARPALRRHVSFEEIDAAIDRRQRIAPILTENGDKFFPQGRVPSNCSLRNTSARWGLPEVKMCR